MKEKAYFVFRPRRIEDLKLSNPDGKWMEYRIVRTICLSKIDFENFATDLLADRQFIEDNAMRCIERGDCLLITNRECSDELLVIPWQNSFVHRAALRPAIHMIPL